MFVFFCFRITLVYFAKMGLYSMCYFCSFINLMIQYHQYHVNMYMLFFFLVVLGIKLSVFCMLGKCFTSELSYIPSPMSF
jgi:hypothetical protein